MIHKVANMVRAEIWRHDLNRRLRQHPPVFAYQMGKVASRGITEPLHDYYPGVVIHDHVFGGDKMQGETRELFKYVTGANQPELLYMISLVREPIARNVSAFFNNFKIHVGMSPEEWQGGLDALKELYLERFPHDQPLYWFERSIEHNFGIDIYRTPFLPNDAVVITQDKVRLLILRMEAADEIKSESVARFLNISRDYHVQRTNERKNKDGANLYRQFVDWVTFDSQYVDLFCKSRYFNHFYSREFVAKTRSRWIEGINR